MKVPPMRQDGYGLYLVAGASGLLGLASENGACNMYA